MIELLFTSTPGPFGAAIRWRTASRWSHVDVVLPGRYGSAEPTVIGATALHGMQRRPLAKALRYSTRYGIAMVSHVPDEEAVYDYLLDHEGEGYGWIDILGFVIGRGIDSKQHFCSEAVTRALANGQRSLFYERPELVTPRDLWIAIAPAMKDEWERRYPWGEFAEVVS